VNQVSANYRVRAGDILPCPRAHLHLPRSRSLSTKPKHVITADLSRTPGDFWIGASLLGVVVLHPRCEKDGMRRLETQQHHFLSHQPGSLPLTAASASNSTRRLQHHRQELKPSLALPFPTSCPKSTGLEQFMIFSNAFADGGCWNRLVARTPTS
jgi:hypothetical protein